MMYKFISLAFVVLIFCFPPILGEIVKILIWIFSLEYKGASVSLIGDIILRIIGPFVAGGIVTFIHIKNKELNDIMLTIVGIIVGFVLSYVVMILEQYGYIILFSLITLITIFIFLNIFFHNTNKFKKNKKI